MMVYHRQYSDEEYQEMLDRCAGPVDYDKLGDQSLEQYCQFCAIEPCPVVTGGTCPTTGESGESGDV